MINYLAIVLMVFLSGCSLCSDWLYLPESKAEERSLYIISHGWHTAIIFPQDELGAELEFLQQDLGYSLYFEFGWGDAGFYQADEITSSLAMSALFWPTPSVMHVVSLSNNPEYEFPDSEIIKIYVSETALKKLRTALAGSFKLDENGDIKKLAKGLYGRSLFYEGEGDYFLTYTSNTWTADMLDTAGIPVRTFLTLTASSVMGQVSDAAESYQYCLSEVNK